MFRGEPTALGAIEQAHVATWTFKTQLMLQFQNTRRDPEPQDLEWLQQQRSPTPRTFVWLGMYIGHELHKAWGRTLTMDLAPTPNLADVRRDDVVDVVATTLCVGHLVLHTFHVSKGVRLTPALPPEVAPFLVQIWPKVGDRVAWPPPWAHDSLVSVGNLADAFSNNRAT